MTVLNKVTTHYVALTDTRTPIGRQLKQGNATFNATGLTVQTMMKADDNTLIHDWTATGASWNDATVSKAQYDFQAADVATAGTYWLFFRVGDGSEWDTFPPDGDKVRVVVTDPKNS